MGIVKITTTKVSRIGAKLFTEYGIVQFDAKLVAEVEEDLAKKLIAEDESFKLFVEKKPAAPVKTPTTDDKNKETSTTSTIVGPKPPVTEETTNLNLPTDSEGSGTDGAETGTEGSESGTQESEDSQSDSENKEGDKDKPTAEELAEIARQALEKKKADFMLAINNYLVEDLKKMAIEEKLPEAEYKSLKKSELVVYLAEKLITADEIDEETK